MAMNKKEQAYVEGLEEKIKRLQAWKLTGPAPPRDLPRPPNGSAHNCLTKGWDINTYMLREGNISRSGSVYKACSTSVSHGAGWDKTTSQGPRDLFSTQLLAWQAARVDVEENMMRVLAFIDTQINALSSNVEEEPIP